MAAAGSVVRRVRDDALTKIGGGLRAVYRTLERPGKNPLKDAHAALDAAVAGGLRLLGQEALLAQLLELNLAVAAKKRNHRVVYTNTHDAVVIFSIRHAAIPLGSRRLLTYRRSLSLPK